MKNEEQKDGYQKVCALSELVEDRGHIFRLGAERIALFNHGGKVFAVSNVCQHQNGPIGEGRVVNGCITCPWHSYQYLPETGASPPPFKERISTFQVLVQNERVTPSLATLWCVLSKAWGLGPSRARSWTANAIMVS